VYEPHFSTTTLSIVRATRSKCAPLVLVAFIACLFTSAYSNLSTSSRAVTRARSRPTRDRNSSLCPGPVFFHTVTCSPQRLVHAVVRV
jgi:hypothetical protein